MIRLCKAAIIITLCTKVRRVAVEQRIWPVIYFNEVFKVFVFYNYVSKPSLNIA